MYQKYTLIIKILVVSIFLQSCGENESTGNNKELEGTLTISGAFALYPLVVKWGQEFEKLHPKVKVDVSAGGAGKGMADVLHHNVNLGMVSRDMNQEEIKQGAWGITVAKDAVLPTINVNNPYLQIILQKGISREQFEKIWVTKEIKTWGQLLGNGSKDPINTYTRSDAAGAGETWARFFDKHQEDLKGIGVFGDPGLAHAIEQDKFAIGYNNIAYVYDIVSKKTLGKIGVIPIDLNGNGKLDSDENFYENRDSLIHAISKKKYPSPPGRELYFVSNGPPKDQLSIEFYKYILTDGQKFVPLTGYLPLPQLMVEAELDILGEYVEQQKK